MALIVILFAAHCEICGTRLYRGIWKKMTGKRGCFHRAAGCYGSGRRGSDRATNQSWGSDIKCKERRERDTMAVEKREKK